MLPNTGPLWMCMPTAWSGAMLMRRTSTRWVVVPGKDWFRTTVRLTGAASAAAPVG
jgi:hypothetical protein